MLIFGKVLLKLLPLPAKVIQSALGHEDTSATLIIYADVTKELKKNVKGEDRTTYKNELHFPS
jgi:hypothetical protein